MSDGIGLRYDWAVYVDIYDSVSRSLCPGQGGGCWQQGEGFPLETTRPSIGRLPLV